MGQDEHKEVHKSETPDSKAPAAAKGKGSTRKKKVALVVGILLVAAAVVVAVILLNRPKPEETTVVTADNYKMIEQEIEEAVEQGMFQTYMNNVWRFPDGSSASSNVVMGNSPNNHYPMWFEVKLEDSKELVYTSSLLPIGTMVDEMILSKDLDAGEYPALVGIHMVDDEGNEIESNASFKVTLVING